MTRDGRLRVCILQLPWPPQFGGHGTQMERTLPFLEAQGVDPEALVTQCPGLDPAIRASERYPIHRLLASSRSRTAIPRRLLEIRRFFAARRGDFDVCHVAFPRWEFALCIPFLKRLGVAVVLESVLLESDDPLAIRRTRLGQARLRLLERADAWVAISRAFGPSFQAAGLPASRMRVIHVGVDVSAHRPRSPAERAALRLELGVPPDARVVVSVGSLMARKGMDRLLEAWSRLAPAAGRDLLVLVGPSSAAEGLPPEDVPHAGSLAQRARAPDLDGTVRIVGHSDRVADWMGAADVFAFLSRREGFGTVTAEAMSTALPCVISPMDGIADELIEDGVEGFVCRDPDDAEAVARCLATLLGDAALRARMGEAGRRRAVDRFSLETRARLLSELYREVAGRGR